MSDTPTSPLLSLPGAVAGNGIDAGVAAHYGSFNGEQRTLEAGDGFVDLSHRDVLRVSGPDRLTWLHDLTSQHLLALAPGVPTAALILSGMGPVSRPEARQGMAAVNRLMYGLSGRASWVVRALSWAMFRTMARSLRRPAKEGEPPGPLDLFGDPAARPALLTDIDEAVLRPGTRGLVEELALYSRPWGFSLEDIDLDVHLWHGEDDHNVPAALAR